MIFAQGVPEHRYSRAGKSLTLLPARHGDHHGLWIDPDDPRHLIESSDGGASVSLDGGKTWSRTDNNQPTAQFYHVVTDNRFPYRVYGAQQDNSSVSVQSRSDTGVIGEQQWYPIGIGESAYIAVDPRDPDIAYGSTSSGAMVRYDHRVEQTQVLRPWPVETAGRGADELLHRFQRSAAWIPVPKLAAMPEIARLRRRHGSGIWSHERGRWRGGRGRLVRSRCWRRSSGSSKSSSSPTSINSVVRHGRYRLTLATPMLPMRSVPSPSSCDGSM